LNKLTLKKNQTVSEKDKNFN